MIHNNPSSDDLRVQRSIDSIYRKCEESINRNNKALFTKYKVSNYQEYREALALERAEKYNVLPFII